MLQVDIAISAKITGIQEIMNWVIVDQQKTTKKDIITRRDNKATEILESSLMHG